MIMPSYHFTMNTCYLFLVLLLGLYCHCVSSCVEGEREALLQFKEGIRADHCGLLTSWGDHEDCCQWKGIHCDNITNHVSELHLHGYVAPVYVTKYLGEFRWQFCLEGEVTPSLVQLKRLKYLDLSWNSFYQPFPSFIGSLTDLEHLNLHEAGFVGVIPVHLRNLTKLSVLDLSSGYPQLSVNSLQWVSGLTSLRYLDLSGANLSKVTNLFPILKTLPSLRVLLMDVCILSPTMVSPLYQLNSSTTLRVISLRSSSLNETLTVQYLLNAFGDHLRHLDLSFTSLVGLPWSGYENMHSLLTLDLSFNKLEGPLPDTFWKMTSLSYLDLSFNKLDGPLPDTISNLRNLVYLNLSYNNFHGCIPKNLGSLCKLHDLNLEGNKLVCDLSTLVQSLDGCSKKSLTSLSLASNQLWGSIPDTINRFSSLQSISLSGNQLNGTISESIGQLPLLESLYLADNSLTGTLTHQHLSNLSNLRDLSLSSNPVLEVNISSSWVPPFQLDTIFLSSCKLGPDFPKWLLTQRSFMALDISSANISDTLPATFWSSLPSTLRFFDASQNKIHGTIPNVSIMFNNFPIIDLSSNHFEGVIPSFPSNISSLFLNNNKFSDSSLLFCGKTGMKISNLDLSDNILAREVPDCFMNFEQLSVLHLENNKFSGSIPTSIGALKHLCYLNLHNNSFSGMLPTSILNCKSLGHLDLGHNSLTGYLPPDIGIALKNLAILIVRENNLSGTLPLIVCKLTKLQILDLSFNHFSGAIPKCIHNLTEMIEVTGFWPEFRTNVNISFPDSGSYSAYQDSTQLMWKRSQQTFMENTNFVRSIDLSHNELVGKIPDAISSLIGLVSLDLSSNKLSGSIPSAIGQLTSLEFLDLSNNNLSGQIPASLVKVNSLAMFNVSNNHLSGEIPHGTQLQGFYPSSYKGNPALCGAPLLACGRVQAPPRMRSDDDIALKGEDDDEAVFPGLYASVVLGFIIGFWGVCGTLTVKRSWRHAYFRFVEELKDKLCAIVEIKAKVWRRT